MRNSLRSRLNIIFIVLAIGPLLLVGIILARRSFTTEGEQALELQRQVAQRVKAELDAYLQDVENDINLLLGEIRGLEQPDRAQQMSLLLGAFTSGEFRDLYDEFTLLDGEGQERLRLSRQAVIAQSDLISRAGQPEFEQPRLTGQTYFSPVWFDEATSKPLLTIAIPYSKPRSVQLDGVLLINIRFTIIRSLIQALQIGNDQQIYVVDDQHRVVAHQDTGLELRDRVFEVPAVGGQYLGLLGDPVVLAADKFELGEQEFLVVAEQLRSEALAPAYSTIRTIAVITVIALVLASVLGFFVVGQIVRPIEAMSATAQAVSAGDLSQQAKVAGQDEIATLGRAFNSMTTQLRELVDSLEQRVADRTERLQIVAALGERLSAVLDFDQLLLELVNQVKERFGYYHAHVYILDDDNQNLQLMAGAGETGEAMKAQAYAIPLDASASLVAQAARSGEIVVVDNVREIANWRPDPLLPNTYAEMAVPIILDGKVVGALDVQEDRVAGLDESDAGVLRSLANQVAVSLTNARLFQETTQARDEADQAREEVEATNKTLEVQIWQTAGLAQLNDKMRGDLDITTLANNIVQQLARYMAAQIGALYVVEEDQLVLMGRYAFSSAQRNGRFTFGEGLIGQAALEKQPIIVSEVPSNYINVRSGLGETVPRHLMIYPFIYDDQVLGVLELGTLQTFNQTELDFMQTALPSIAIAFNTALSRARIHELLNETQRQAEELQAQGEELRVANEELEAQTESLRNSEGRLREKQQELEGTNTQLEEKQSTLDRQNQILKRAQQDLEKRAEELAMANRYKSEFLSNMSHELRTPLNSLLILARMLSENDAGNLTDEQVEFANIIYGAGTDLLTLINDILDLAKVEAGNLVFHFGPMPISELTQGLQAQFGHLAQDKGLAFEIEVGPGVPEQIETDEQRLKQIVKNLLANAFKFTSQGQVRVRLYRPESDVDLSRSGLNAEDALAIEVQDTGIGIAEEQRKIIFEAFQQGDGGVSRQFGGTGLGLTISRELAARLGGQIELSSVVGEGSTFILYLPVKTSEAMAEVGLTTVTSSEPEPSSQSPSLPPIAPMDLTVKAPTIPDDRDNLSEQDKIVLIIEDDVKFAKIVYDFAQRQGFKGLVAVDGQSGLALVRAYQPDAIILDLRLPDITGWEVMEILKHDPATRHIPVHIISAEEEMLDAYRRGAIGYLTKPVGVADLAGSFERIEQFIAQSIKSLLLVEDDGPSRQSIKALLGGSDVQISEAARGEQALQMLKAQHFDCLILDLSLPDMSGFEVLNRLNEVEGLGHCPVIVYTGRDLTQAENEALMQYADSVIVKGVKSPERLLDETALFLHRVVAEMPADKQQTIKQLYNDDGLFEGKRVLVVDDDMRNAFALSKLLSDKGIVVRMAQNGQKALDMLTEAPVDLVLMDIMMPIMDGYEATRRIRAQTQWRRLPILALTAKAMKGDREKCLEAGANDYLPKPIDVDRLYSMLRVWLYQ